MVERLTKMKERKARPRTTDRACATCTVAKSAAHFRDGRDECRACEKVMCTNCGLLPQSAFGRECVKHHMYNGRNVCCLTCKRKGVDPRSGAYKRAGENARCCVECGVAHAPSNFRRDKGGLVPVCRDCELIARDGCRRSIPSTNFESADRHHHYSHGRRATCCECKARVQTLRAKFQKSARKRCTCGRSMGHKQTCPMHPRRAGEAPYPACDVLSRDDSEWLDRMLTRRKL